MTQRTTGWRSVFSLPAVYRFAQRSIGSPEVRSAFVNERVRPAPGDRILDIGCGTGDIVQLLGEAKYTGYDPSAEYIESARERYGDLGAFFVGEVGAVDLEAESFDICIAKGVLHHLDDDAATALFGEAARVLRPGGRLVTMDPVFTDDQSRIARFLAERDRGQNVRTPDEYERLALEAFEHVDTQVRHDLLRVPYSHALLSCTR
jgi:ubiquinone/menaquinone biosynthesis C-methylase UbiE